MILGVSKDETCGCIQHDYKSKDNLVELFNNYSKSKDERTCVLTINLEVEIKRWNLISNNDCSSNN